MNRIVVKDYRFEEEPIGVKFFDLPDNILFSKESTPGFIYAKIANDGWRSVLCVISPILHLSCLPKVMDYNDTSKWNDCVPRDNLILELHVKSVEK